MSTEEVLIAAAIKIAILVGGLMTGAAYFVLLERRMAAWIQDRHGPNRVGAPLSVLGLGSDWSLAGLGQPLADGVKFILKQEYTPAHVDRRLFVLAPLSILAAALAVFAVIPFGAPLPPLWEGGSEIPLVVAPGVDIGMIYVFALSSIAVYGVILGGWASNNKYSFLGGLRSSAQLIAYELPLGLGIVGVVLATGSLRIEEIVGQQASSGVWFAFSQPLGFVIFVVAAFAEAARLPFDLPEAEQELVGGYHTEYSGIKLLLFLVAEFLHMITASFLIVLLFLGGWHLWGLEALLGPGTWALSIAQTLVFLTKVFGVILFFMVVRWTWPRFRFDQLMGMAWKVMLPLGLVNLIAVALLLEVVHPEVALFGVSAANQPLAAAAVVVVGGWIVFVVAWLATAMLGPMETDNRPRLDVDRFGIDDQLG